MKETKFSKILLKIIEICFSIFFIVILLNTIFRNLTTQLDFSKTIMIDGLITSLILLYIIYKIVKKHLDFKLNNIKSKWKIILLTLIFIIQFIIALNVYSDCGWDCGTIVESAANLYKGQEFYEYYFELNPNNILILLIFKTIFSFVGIFYTIQNFMIITVIFNLILIDIAFLATINIAKKILGNKAEILVGLLMIPLVVLSPWMIVPYSDTYTIAIPIIIFYLYTKVKEKENKPIKYLLVALMGILTIAGYYLKPTSIIIIIAIILSEILLGKFNKKDIKEKSKNLIICITTFLVAIIIFLVGYKIWDNIELGKYISKEEREKNSLTMTHYLMMGLNKVPIEGSDKFMYGTINGADFEGSTSREGKKAKQEYNIAVIKQRLSDYGIIGYTKYLYNKANWILSDGTFFYGCEGGFFTSDTYNQNNLSKIFKPYFQIQTDEYKNITANIMQISWILVLFGLIFSINKEENEKQKQINILKFSIIGLIMFILLFEGRSRYLINYLPIFIIVGVYGIKNFFQILDNIENKIRNKIRNK